MESTSGKTNRCDKKNASRAKILGVALAAVFLAGSALAAAPEPVSGHDASSTDYESWHVGFFDANYVFKRTQYEDASVAGVVSYDNVGYAGLEGCQDTGKPYLFIAGFEEDTYEMLPVQLLEGRLPKDGSEVLIPSHLIADTQREYLAGDTLCLAVGPRQDGDDVLSQHVPYRPGAELLSVGEEQSYTVVGIYAKPAFETEDAPGYTLITAADPTVPVESISVFVSLQEVEEVYNYADSTAPGTAYAVNSKLLQE